MKTPLFEIDRLRDELTALEMRYTDERRELVERLRKLEARWQRVTDEGEPESAARRGNNVSHS